jgi:hypothetical protein
MGMMTLPPPSALVCGLTRRRGLQTQHILSDGKPLGPDAEGNRFNPNFIALATGTHTAGSAGRLLPML